MCFGLIIYGISYIIIGNNRLTFYNCILFFFLAAADADRSRAEAVESVEPRPRPRPWRATIYPPEGKTGRSRRVTWRYSTKRRQHCHRRARAPRAPQHPRRLPRRVCDRAAYPIHPSSPHPPWLAAPRRVSSPPQPWRAPTRHPHP